MRWRPWGDTGEAIPHPTMRGSDVAVVFPSVERPGMWAHTAYGTVQYANTREAAKAECERALRGR